jgi:DNA primase
MAKTGRYEQIIKELKTKYHLEGRSEMVMDCPDRGCPNPRNHLYMNRNSGQFICHRCGLTGNMVTFLTIVKRVSYKQAKKILSDEEEVSKTNLSVLKKRVEEVKAVEVALHLLKEDGVLRNVIQPPRESKPVTRNEFPAYLKKRKLPLSMAALMGVRYCNSGRYASRIIFPFSCSEHQSFVAYATRKAEKKTLNPPGSYNKDLLFGYDLIHEIKSNKSKVKRKWVSEKPAYRGLVVVEGIFDFVRMFSYGYWCVALLKSHLSASQAVLLNNSRFKTITFLLDGDVTDEEYKRKLHNINLIDSKRVRIARIPNEDNDPDKLTPLETAILLRDATEKLNKISELRKKAERLKNQQ